VRSPAFEQNRYAGYRVMGIDGSTLDVPDEQVDAQAFGYPSGGRGEAAYPQIRFVALAECATHALCRIQMSGLGDSEQALTRQLFPGFSADMLVLADRLFYGYEMWRDAMATAAKLPWPSEVELPVAVRSAADGWFLPEHRLCQRHRSATPAQWHPGAGHRVSPGGVPDAEPLYRLITNLLEPATAPAADLAALYTGAGR
jgi:hypothetical protein